MSPRTASATSTRWRLAVAHPAVRGPARRLAPATPPAMASPSRPWCAGSSRSSSAGSPCVFAIGGGARRAGDHLRHRRLRRARTSGRRRGLAIAGLVTGAFGDTGRRRRPACSRSSCSGRSIATRTRLTRRRRSNRARSRRDALAPRASSATTGPLEPFHRLRQVPPLPSGFTIERPAAVASTAPGETAQFVVEHRLEPTTSSARSPPSTVPSRSASRSTDACRRRSLETDVGPD